MDGGKGSIHVTSGCVRQLVKGSVKDLKIAFRLDDRHIDVQGVKIINVRLAARLMSETTAKSIRFLGEQGLLQSKHWKPTSDLLMLVAKWFDLFNSRTANAGKSSRDAYGCHLKEQNELLDNA